MFRLGLRPRGSTTEAVERRLGCVSQDFLPRCDIRTTAGMGRDGTGRDRTGRGTDAVRSSLHRLLLLLGMVAAVAAAEVRV